VVSRRLIGAPSDYLASAEVQAIKAELDRAFLLGDVNRFSRTAVRLIQRCEQVSRERGIAPWWFIQA